MSFLGDFFQLSDCFVWLEKDPNVFARIHPRHAYTLSGLDVVNIPKGKHRIELAPLDSNLNVLIRMIEKPFKKFKDSKNSDLVLIQNDNVDERILKVGNKNLKYFSILAQNLNDKLFFNAKGGGTVKITSRTTFKDEKRKEYYKFKIRENNKLISTHHMFSSISKGTKIRKSDLGVSKFKTTFISVPNSDAQYEIEAVLPSDREILFRMVQEK